MISDLIITAEKKRLSDLLPNHYLNVKPVGISSSSRGLQITANPLSAKHPLMEYYGDFDLASLHSAEGCVFQIQKHFSAAKEQFLKDQQKENVQ